MARFILTMGTLLVDVQVLNADGLRLGLYSIPATPSIRDMLRSSDLGFRISFGLRPSAFGFRSASRCHAPTTLMASPTRTLPERRTSARTPWRFWSIRSRNPLQMASIFSHGSLGA